MKKEVAVLDKTATGDFLERRSNGRLNATFTGCIILIRLLYCVIV